MTQAIQKKESGVEAIAKQTGNSPEYVQTIKDAFAKGATDLELQLFLETAKRTGLNPMARQIYCIQRYSGGVKTMSTQVSIDGFRLIADRTNCYVPGRESTFTFDENGNVQSATAYIKKLVGGVWHEVSATAFYEEYVQTTKEGKPNSMWKKMPRLMLNKCAESLVLRKAFPAELSGLYTAEEMGTAEIPPSDIEADLKQVQFEISHEDKALPVETEIETIDGEIIEEKPKTSVEATRDEIENLLNALGIDPALALEKYDKIESGNGSRKAEFLHNVRVKFIKDKIASPDWTLSEDGTTGFLAKSNIEGIDNASAENIADCVRRIRQMDDAPF